MREIECWFSRRVVLGTLLAVLVSLPLFSTSRLFRRITAELKDEDYYLNHSQGFTLEPMSKVPMSSDSLNCGCPGSCDATALAKRTDGLPFACQERIEYLMTRYGDSQSKACTAAVQGGACGLECDPKQCIEKNGSVEYDEDKDSSLNCGCSSTCDAAALAKQADGLPFSCQERIEYLMTRYGDSQSKACSTAVQGGACGLECLPDQSRAHRKCVGYMTVDEKLHAADDKMASPRQEERSGVIVLGMHRSGTSMLSGLLVTGFGYHTGDPLIGANPSNPKGHFELLPVMRQNDEFMKKQRIAWNVGVIKYDNNKGIQQYKSGEVEFKEGKRALQFLNHKNSIPYLQKDPRMCITLPTWLQLLHKEPTVVFTYRHPLEVAMSLQARNGMRLLHGLHLWIVYNMQAIQNSQGLCRVLTSNNAILTNAFTEVQRIADELTKKCGVTNPPNELSQEIVNEFVDPQLQKQKRRRENKTVERDVISSYNGCTVYDYGSSYMGGSRHKKEMEMYKIAMRIYCDLESGKAYETKYKWPKL